MKKLITIGILLLYSLASSGYTVYIHFCCGKVDAVSLAPVHQKNCAHGSEAMEGCCSNASVHFETDTTLPPAAVPKIPLQLSAHLPCPVVLETILSLQGGVHAVVTGDALPPPLQTERTILFCTYRI